MGAIAKINVPQALELRLVKQLEFKDIASRYGVTDSAVCQALKPFTDLILPSDQLAAYQANKAKLLDSAAWRIIQQMLRPEVLKKASFNNLGYGLSAIFKESHLLRGQATKNINIYSTVNQLRQDIHSSRDKIKALEAEYEELDNLMDTDT